ncbi:MAG: type II secretion system protein GspN [Deltaproteobacteria bacterium]|nr:type II secretion system protein GspN [Deltaproteobacteria bacterium]
MKNFTRWAIYIIVGLVGFITFLYFSFPYDVLKESIAVETTNATGMAVSIGDLGPSFPLGIEIENTKLGTSEGNEIQIPYASVQVSVLPLLWAHIDVDVEIEDRSQGTLDLSLGLSLFDLLKGSRMILPSSVEIEADKFLFGDLAEFGVKMFAASPGTSLFLKPILEKMGIDGKLKAEVDLSLNVSDFSLSTGTVSFDLKDTVVQFDESMQIPSQKFETAILKASLQNGTATIDKNSRFRTKDLDIAFEGKVLQKTKIEQSVLDISVNLQLFQELRKQFGFALNAISGKETEGKLLIKISGPISPAPKIDLL